MLFFLLIFLTGSLAGMVVGFIGTGSTLVSLPLFSMIFPHILKSYSAFHVAIGTTIAVNSVGATTLAISNYRKKNYNSALIKEMLLPACIGGMIAPWLLHFFIARWLHLYIGAVIFIVAIVQLQQMITRKNKQLTPINCFTNIVMVLVISLISGSGGISLGILLVPYLSRHIEHEQAVGTSVIIASFYAILTVIGYIITGWGNGLDDTIGYVYFPAFIVSSLAIIVFTQYGMKLKKYTNQNTAKIIFYFFLLVIGAYIALFSV